MQKFHVVRKPVLSLQRFVPRFSQNLIPKVVTECLASRSLIRIAGATAADYLQGLITNDIKHVVDGAPSMYAMFLNTKGRLLYDSIIYKTSEHGVFLLESDAAIAKDLESHLKKFKVRRKLEIAVYPEFSIHNVSHDNVLKDNKIDYCTSFTEKLRTLKNCTIAPDPRIASLGFRILAPANTSVLDELQRNGFEAIQEDYYRELRLKLGVGEGVEELPVGNCFPLEANCDFLHGVSFQKGCYIGQELTARTHHTGVIRKRYLPLIFETNVTGLEYDSVLTIEGKSVGKVKAVKNRLGLGLLRIDDVLKTDKLVVGDMKCKTYRPLWWPAQAPKARPT